MKTIILLLCLSLAYSSARIIEPKTDQNADKEFLLKQRDLFHLLDHVYQSNFHKDQVDDGRNFDIYKNRLNYNDEGVVNFFLYRYKKGMLPKGHIFNFMYMKNFIDLSTLFELFYSAKEWKTFYSTACWAREFLSEELFVHALYAAVMHREDCYGLKLPPIYEVIPHHFFDSTVIDRAYQVKMQGTYEDLGSDVFDDNGSVVIAKNRTSWLYGHNDEEELAYFTEDIAMNAMYYYIHMDYPFWIMNSTKYHLNYDRHGEFYYYVHQQLLARYYLERLSNGMGKIPNYSLRQPIKNGFYPQMKYFNGIQYPVRPNNYDFTKEQYDMPTLQRVEDYERRIRDAIDSGFYIKMDGSHGTLRTPESIEDLAGIISTQDSPNYFYYKYPTFANKMLIGNSLLPYDQKTVIPSALENYQTCLRDPMFYSIYQRYVELFTRYKTFFRSYSSKELDCSGVKIDSIQVDELITYFDNNDTDITNAVWQMRKKATKQYDDLVIKVRNSRLDHKPFAVTVNVNSNEDKKVVLRLFLGPKYDSRGRLVSIDKSRLDFFEIDQFVYDLKSGKNIIKRDSKDFRWVHDDYEPSREVYDRVVKALEGKGEYLLDEFEPNYGFPHRFILPKGRVGGMPYVLYTIVSPYHAPKTAEGDVMNYKVGTGTRFADSLPMGFPFDRTISDVDLFTNLPNMNFKDVLVYHKTNINNESKQ